MWQQIVQNHGLSLAPSLQCPPLWRVLVSNFRSSLALLLCHSHFQAVTFTFKLKDFLQVQWTLKGATQEGLSLIPCLRQSRSDLEFNMLNEYYSCLKVSADITRKMEGVRSHRVKELQDLKETDRKAERAIKSELERKQQEVEGILKKKKDEEHLKRLEFEEQRIKEENEKMKKDAEEKRKRDLEDLRLQELLKLKEESKPSAVTPSPTPTMKKEAKSEEESEEELRRREEEKIIQLGRAEHHKEFERRRKAAEEKKEAENPAPKKKEAAKVFPKPAPIRQAPISEFLRPAPSLNSGSQKNLVQEHTRTLAVVEDREKGFTSFNVFQANKQMQKPKYQTFADQGRGQHSSSSSSSRFKLFLLF